MLFYGSTAQTQQFLNRQIYYCIQFAIYGISRRDRPIMASNSASRMMIARLFCHEAEEMSKLHKSDSKVSCQQPTIRV